MATNNDVQLVEFSLIEKKIWAYQEQKLELHKLLSWGFGPYVLKVLSSPDMHNITAEEKKDSYLKHMVMAISEQEEFVPSQSFFLYGTRTQTPKEVKTVKGVVKLESPLAIASVWQGLFEKSAGTDNDSAGWRNAWRLAYSHATRFIVTTNELNGYAKQHGVSPAMLAHAQKYWQKESPSMLNKSYQNSKIAKLEKADGTKAIRDAKKAELQKYLDAESPKLSESFAKLDKAIASNGK